MKLPFRIRRVYFDRIVAGTKHAEVRKASIYWQRLVASALREMETHPGEKPVEAVFVCGNKVHRRQLVDITEHNTAKAALGRTPSLQGKRDLGDGPVYKFHLGKEINP